MKKALTISLIIIATTLLIVFLYDKNKTHASGRTYQIGDRLDSLNHVIVYYNGGMGNISGRNTSPDGYNIGLKKVLLRVLQAQNAECLWKCHRLF